MGLALGKVKHGRGGVDLVGGSAGAPTPLVRTSECLAAAFPTTNDTATDTGLELAVNAGAVVLVKVYATVDAGAAGMKFAFACPAGSVIEGWAISTQASLITTIVARFTAINTLTASMANTLVGTMEIFARVIVGVAGTIKFQIASTTAGQTSLVGAGTTMELTTGTPAV